MGTCLVGIGKSRAEVEIHEPPGRLKIVFSVAEFELMNRATFKSMFRRRESEE